ncbi:MAG: hypothetical protein M3680_21355 [Myxococcota bacterium]|nr:hypothetical protein [Myxococcota bacterium]
MADQFSRRDVELILRRTAELELHRDGALDETSAEDLEAIVGELGMSKTSLRQAITEARAGLLADPDAEPSTVLARAFGPGFVEVRRFVPGTVVDVRDAVARFVENQGFHVMRQRPDLTVWEPDGSIGSALRRTFRGGSYRLPRDLQIETHVLAVAGGPHPILVRFRVDTRAVRSSRARGAAAALVAGAGIAVAGAMMLTLPVEAVVYGVGAAVGAGGAYAGRASYHKARERLEIALERFLDFLEQAPPAPQQKDPLSRLVDFLAREWWR